jgi:hypothetical protein
MVGIAVRDGCVGVQPSTTRSLESRRTPRRATRSSRLVLPYGAAWMRTAWPSTTHAAACRIRPRGDHAADIASSRTSHQHGAQRRVLGSVTTVMRRRSPLIR